jgi:branched-chain amino acid transport system ATP-binding protein
MSEALRVEGLAKAYGGLKVSCDISLAMGRGDRVALIGPNGAGKTTFVNLVTGAVKPDAGQVLLNGEDVTHLGVPARVRRGLVRTFQISRLFHAMTVEENVLVALLERQGCTGRMLADARSERDLVREADALLAELGLDAVARRCVREIPYGQQRLVEIAIAMALRPKVLLLDEPAAGVPHSESPRILAALDRLPHDIAVLMIEHDMDFVFRFAKRVVVLAAGSIIFEGAPEAVGQDPRVRQAYLGNYGHARRSA